LTFVGINSTAMAKKYQDDRFNGIWPILDAKNALGQSYTGTMEIYALPKGSHGLRWETSAGEYEGIGMAINGQLYLAFGTTAGYGLAVYTAQEEELIANFTGHGFRGDIGHERILACPGFDHLEDIFALKGWQPDGVSYEGKIAFSAYGEVFLVTWAFEGTTGQYSGVAFVQDEFLLTGYGLPADPTFGCGIYRLEENGCLMSTWATPTSSKLLHEHYGSRLQQELD
jgi:hypothetical protein